MKPATARIMIVESEHFVALDLKRDLRALGYEVVGGATSAAIAINEIGQQQPDIVLMDISLAGAEQDESNAAEEIRSRFDIPVVLTAAFSEEERLVNARLAMPFTYLLKPYSDRDLKLAVEIGLYSAQLERDRRLAETERRQMEAQLRQSQKLESLGLLAGGIAHDFNNLLMGVMGNAETALAKLEEGSPARADIERIQESAQRAAELSTEMLLYSGRGRLEVAAVDLSAVVRGMAHLLEASIAKKAKLHLVLDEGLPPVEADTTQLRQMVMSLVTNASDALGETGGVISIRTGLRDWDRTILEHCYLDDELPDGRYVTLEVSDNGCGMSSVTLSKVFDPFFTTKADRRGLGLSALLGTVRSHRGAIMIDSAPGSGTAVVVGFLATAVTVETVAQPELPSQQTWTDSGTILVIDDEETVRTAACEMIRLIGFEVLSAADGLEGVEVFRRHAERVVLVILDIEMPRMSGQETLPELCRISPEVKVVLSSGYTVEQASERFAGATLAGFIHKPYRLAELRQIIQAALTGRR